MTVKKVILKSAIAGSPPDRREFFDPARRPLQKPMIRPSFALFSARFIQAVSRRIKANQGESRLFCQTRVETSCVPQPKHFIEL
jgi:hypothetical protein